MASIAGAQSPFFYGMQKFGNPVLENRFYDVIRHIQQPTERCEVINAAHSDSI